MIETFHIGRKTVEVVFSGSFFMDNDHDAILKILEDLPDGKEINILYNFLKAEVEVSINSLKLMSKRSIEVLSRFNTVKAAFLVDSPFNTAISILFSELDTNTIVTRKVFNNRENALAWLLPK